MDPSAYLIQAQRLVFNYRNATSVGERYEVIVEFSNASGLDINGMDTVGDPATNPHAIRRWEELVASGAFHHFLEILSARPQVNNG